MYNQTIKQEVKSLRQVNSGLNETTVVLELAKLGAIGLCDNPLR